MQDKPLFLIVAVSALVVTAILATGIGGFGAAYRARIQVLTRQGLTGDEPAPTFAVSIEPRGGSPTGAPTGKVITTFTAVRSL